ncbi:hypothetical protein Tco_1256837 [Tanacetum coccineum]
MDGPNITMEEYIRLEEEKAQKHGKVFNWETAKYDKISRRRGCTIRRTICPPAPKTAKQLAAKRNQERVKSILLLSILDEYLLKFHNVPDAKSLWAAIKSRF